MRERGSCSIRIIMCHNGHRWQPLLDTETRELTLQGKGGRERARGQEREKERERKEGREEKNKTIGTSIEACVDR